MSICKTPCYDADLPLLTRPKTPMTETIIYEYPLNEVIRVCLRLEQLFQQIDHQLKDSTIMGTRGLIHTIINVLHILDRPDLKAKLAKELSALLFNLQRYGNLPDIDEKKLNQLIFQLDELARGLIDSSGKIGQRLRDMELLNSLRTHFASPGGGCCFDSPLLHHWLQQSTQTRTEIIHSWLNEFIQIRSAVNLVLELVRNNAHMQEKNAVKGFYQELLDSQINLRMIRIGIENTQPTYPEISFGKHFFSIQFFEPQIEVRPAQFNGNLRFWAAYCAVN